MSLKDVFMRPGSVPVSEFGEPDTDATRAAKEYWENKAIEADQHLLDLHAHQLESGSVVLEDPEPREQLTEETD